MLLFSPTASPLTINCMDRFLSRNRYAGMHFAKHTYFAFSPLPTTWPHLFPPKSLQAATSPHNSSQFAAITNFWKEKPPTKLHPAVRFEQYVTLGPSGSDDPRPRPQAVISAAFLPGIYKRTLKLQTARRNPRVQPPGPVATHLRNSRRAESFRLF